MQVKSILCPIDFSDFSAAAYQKPYEKIVRHATEAHASLIIMTARGGDAVDRAVYGSTTYRVIQLWPLRGARGPHVIPTAKESLIL